MKIIKTAWHSFPARIYLLALVLRLVPVLLAADLGIGLDDMFQYDMLARSLAAGKGYRWYAQDDLHLVQRWVPLDFITDNYEPEGVPTSFRAPAYPAFLAVVYLASGLGKRFLAARVVQAFLTASLAPLTFLLARRLFPAEPRVGRWAAGVIAVYPFLVLYTLGLLTENLFMPLLLGGMLALLKAGESRRMRDYVLAGLLFGFAALTRSVVLAVFPVAILWAWFAAKDRKGAFVLVGCIVLVTAPWIVRNSRLHGEPTMIETSMGYNLHMGYHPEGQGTFDFDIALELLPYLDDKVRNQLGTDLALGFIRKNPGRVPELALNKLGYFFALEHRPVVYFYSNGLFGHLPPVVLGAVLVLFMVPFAGIALLAAVGLAFMPWRKQTVLIGWMLGAYLIPHVLIMAEPRLHVAVLPFLAVLAGYAWVQRRMIWSETKTPGGKWRLAAAGLLIGLLVINWGVGLRLEADSLRILFGPDGNQTYFNY